jgi:hypothetical protein
MAENIDKPEWKEFLRNFSTRHRGHRTRLGLFEIRDGVVNDLWIEDGIPLVGIDIDTKEGRQTIGIVFEHFRHSIKNVSTISEVSGENVAAGLDIQDSEGKTTALRFEDYVVESED